MSRPSLIVNARAAKRLSEGYPWVFRSDVTDGLPGLHVAQAVTFCGPNGSAVASGYANPKTQLLGRVLARGEAALDHALFTEKFRTALAWREQAFPGQDYYRLVHAESDGLPGLIIDRFGDLLVIQVNTAGMEALQDVWLPALLDVVDVPNVVLKNDGNGRAMEGLGENFTMLCGALQHDARAIVVENGVKFWADVKDGQKTGWFFDQRPHRLWVAQQAKGKRVADIFCHTGGFGLTAAAHGAAHVTFVDASGPALALARDNAALNSVADQCESIAGKAFDVLERMTPRSFDIVCVDPPAFVKSKKDLAAGLRGYEKLARQAAPLVTQGGLLFYASCSSHPSESEMLQAILAGAAKAKRTASLVYSGTAGPDHPMHPMLPETRYLKAFGFRIT